MNNETRIPMYFTTEIGQHYIGIEDMDSFSMQSTLRKGIFLHRDQGYVEIIDAPAPERQKKCIGIGSVKRIPMHWQ